jgi:hypothetical protein
MKTLPLSLFILAGPLFSQTVQPHQAMPSMPRQRPPRPSDVMATSLPAQDVVICLPPAGSNSALKDATVLPAAVAAGLCAVVHADSDPITAISKQRVDDFKGVVNNADGSVTLQPKSANVAQHLGEKIKTVLFPLALKDYPGPNAQAIQKKLAEDQAAYASATTQSATVEVAPVAVTTP